MGGIERLGGHYDLFAIHALAEDFVSDAVGADLLQRQGRAVAVMGGKEDHRLDAVMRL